jgi:hypothetical protein
MENPLKMCPPRSWKVSSYTVGSAHLSYKRPNPYFWTFEKGYRVSWAEKFVAGSTGIKKALFSLTFNYLGPVMRQSAGKNCRY